MQIRLHSLVNWITHTTLPVGGVTGLYVIALVDRLHRASTHCTNLGSRRLNIKVVKESWYYLWLLAKIVCPTSHSTSGLMTAVTPVLQPTWHKFLKSILNYCFHQNKKPVWWLFATQVLCLSPNSSSFRLRVHISVHAFPQSPDNSLPVVQCWPLEAQTNNTFPVFITHSQGCNVNLYMVTKYSWSV